MRKVICKSVKNLQLSVSVSVSARVVSLFMRCVPRVRISSVRTPHRMAAAIHKAVASVWLLRYQWLGVITALAILS